MLLLDFMLFKGVTQYKKATKATKIGLVKYHFDIVFEEYSSQNNLQIMVALQKILPYIKEKFLKIETAVLLSDNSSCFSSHNCIPFVHYLNDRFHTEFHPPKVFFCAKK